MDLTKGSAKVGKRIKTGGEYRYVAKGTSDWPDDTGLYQYTTCGGCNVKLISWSKRAECPKCKKSCYLT